MKTKSAAATGVRSTALCAICMLVLSVLPCLGQADKETQSAPASVLQAVEKTKPATTDQIPDVLKDLVPKDGDTSLSPAAGAKPPAAPEAPPAPSVPGVVQSAAQKAAASAPPPAASRSEGAHARITLRGRLEEIGGRGASLPAGVVLNLKTGTARLDPTVEKKMQGRVASFPFDWRGSWSGTLTVWTNQYDPSAFDFDREATLEEQRILAPGQTASVTFNFFVQNNATALQPAQLVFRPRSDSPISRQMQEQLRNSPLNQMLGPQGAQMLSLASMATPVFVLGDMNGMGVTGNTLNNQLIKNDIRELKPGVLEQNLVVEKQEKHRTTGAVEKSIGETIIRFTKISSSALYVQAASVSYGWDGHFQSKVIFYGTVNKGAPSTPLPAGFPSGFPGAFPMPGLNPSEGGMNLNDLNNLLKQMQGM